ncbi:MAG: hypothetical protein FWG55_05900 [Candidatus Bathyarchaeota archaeon]|nr:hypothetical protein [Candidatus Termiticorpusculum sp.]
MNLINRVWAGITGSIALIAAIITIYVFITGNVSLDEVYTSSSSSQTNPTATVTAMSTATPNPTQQSTSATPSPNSSSSNGGNGDGDSSTSTSTSTSAPTPTPTSTPTPTTELSFGEPVSGSITPAIRLNRYSVVLPQAGRLTINVAKGGPIAPSYLQMRLMNSNDEQLEVVRDVFHGGVKASDTKVDLEAGTYYIQLEEYVFLYNTGSPSLSNGAYTLTVKFVPF